MPLDAPAMSGSCPWCGIDAHAHFFPAEWVELVEKEGPKHGVILGRSPQGFRTAVGGGMPFKHTFKTSMVDVDVIVDSMKPARLDLRVLSLTNPMNYWAPAGLGLELSQAFNDACGRATEKYPNAIRGAITLPMQDPDLALKELERGSTIPGMCCVYMAMHVNGTNIGDKRFWKIFEFCEAKKLPVCLHPVFPCGEERMGKQHMSNLIGNPHESAIGAFSLIFDGALDAFPRLEVLLPHAGGSFPWLVWRWDNGVRRRPELTFMKKLASDYLRRFHYDTISHSPPLLRHMIEMIGVDRIVIGTDYNMDAGYDLPVDVVEEIPGLTDKEKALILAENAYQLFNLGQRSQSLVAAAVRGEATMQAPRQAAG